MDETLKSLRAAYYVLLTVCGTLALFGVSVATDTPYRRALREIDELQRIPWANLANPDSLHAFVFRRPGVRLVAEDRLPLAEVLLREMGRVEPAAGGRRRVTLALDRVTPIDTLFLLDRRFEVDLAGAASDGPGRRADIAPPPVDAPLAAYETYLRANPAFESVVPAPRYRVSTGGTLSGTELKDACPRAGRPCVLAGLRALRDTVSGGFKLLASVGGLSGQALEMEMTFRPHRGQTDLRLADWLARYPRASRLLRGGARAGQGSGLVFLPALGDVWPEVRGLTPGQARLLLASKVRSAEQPVRVLGLDVPARAIALAGPIVLLALLAHLGLLLRHLRGLMEAGGAERVREFPLPLLFPGASGALAGIVVSLVFPAVALSALYRRVPMEGIGRYAFGLGVLLVAALGARLALRLAALRRAVGGPALRDAVAAAPRAAPEPRRHAVGSRR